MALVGPVVADPVVGVGLTFWFGSGQTQTGVGLRVFSDDEDGAVVGSVGVDYILQGGAVRPTLGIASLQDNAYLGLDLGFDLAGGPLHYGAGLGVTNTADEPVVVTQTPPVVTTPPVAQTPGEGPKVEDPDLGGEDSPIGGGGDGIDEGPPDFVFDGKCYPET